MSPQTQIQQPSKSLILQKFDSIVKDDFILRLISETLPALQGDTANVPLRAAAGALTSHLERSSVNSKRSAEHSG